MPSHELTSRNRDIDFAFYWALQNIFESTKIKKKSQKKIQKVESLILKMSRLKILRPEQAS